MPTDAPAAAATGPGAFQVSIVAIVAVFAGGREEEPVADRETADLDAAGDDAPRVELVDVLDREAERQILLARRRGEPVERLDDGRCGAPRHAGRAGCEVVAVAGRDRDDVLCRDADRGEIGRHIARHSAKRLSE